MGDWVCVAWASCRHDFDVGSLRSCIVCYSSQRSFLVIRCPTKHGIVPLRLRRLCQYIQCNCKWQPPGRVGLLGKNLYCVKKASDRRCRVFVPPVAGKTDSLSKKWFVCFSLVYIGLVRLACQPVAIEPNLLSLFFSNNKTTKKPLRALLKKAPGIIEESSGHYWRKLRALLKKAPGTADTILGRSTSRRAYEKWNWLHSEMGLTTTERKQTSSELTREEE